MVVILHGTPRGRGYRLAEDTLELAEKLGGPDWRKKPWK
jgi:hypothetical protein